MSTPRPSTRRPPRLVALLIAGTALFGTASCGSVEERVGDSIGDEIAEQAVDGATGGDVRLTEDGLTLRTDDEPGGSSAGEIPDRWPSEIIPVPDTFTVGDVTESTTPLGDRMTVASRGEGDVADLVDSYVDRFESHGVDVTHRTVSGTGGAVVGQRDATRYEVTLGRGADDAGVELVLQVTTPAG